MKRFRRCVVGAACAGAVGLGLACGGDGNGGGVTPSPLSDAGIDGDLADVSAPLDASPSLDATLDAPAPVAVSFTYQPQWAGVKRVEVIGGFGEATDWSKKTPFLTLTEDGTGTFRGSASLAPSAGYLYVFRVTGDGAASDPLVETRYAVDPLNPAVAACPAASPTYSPADANPCSMLAVPQGAPATPIHVRGSLTVDGNPATGWIVLLERDKARSHHFFVNRVTAGADGRFDLVGAPGHYRLQALHPTYLSQTDLERSPLQLGALRRALSSPFALDATDLVVTAPDLAFHTYAQFRPTGDGGTLPTQFTFQQGGPTRLDVYGGPGDGGVVEIGDPWFTSPATVDGGASFDGVFSTAKADQDAAAPGTRYMWGTEESYDASVPWTKQTMVFPITWR